MGSTQAETEEVCLEKVRSRGFLAIEVQIGVCVSE